MGSGVLGLFDIGEDHLSEYYKEEQDMQDGLPGHSVVFLQLLVRTQKHPISIAHLLPRPKEEFPASFS